MELAITTLAFCGALVSVVYTLQMVSMAVFFYRTPKLIEHLLTNEEAVRKLLEATTKKGIL
jgi:hypothetical protein